MSVLRFFWSWTDCWSKTSKKTNGKWKVLETTISAKALLSRSSRKQYYIRWEEYKSLNKAEKESYFKEKIQFKETIPYHFLSQNSQLVFKIKTSIVEKVIGDMFFHPDDEESQTKAMKLFTSCDSGSSYSVTIKDPLQFQLIIPYLDSGLSFRQVENVFNKTKKLTSNALLGNITHSTAANYAHIVCALNFQRLADILNNTSIWAFSLANDSSTHYRNFYFNNRIHFHLRGILYNIDAIAIPMFDWHTGENMYDLISNFLDVIYLEWRSKLIGVGTDGASSMTGVLKGVTTRLENDAQYGLYRVWCGLHQLDLVMKYAYKDLKNSKFNDILHGLTNHLCHQQNLITDMRSKCPKAITTCWTAVGYTCQWLLEHRVTILQYIAENDPDRTPLGWWWVIVAGISAIAKQVNIALVKLQEKNLLISQQRQELDHLLAIICAQIIVEGLFTKV